MSILLIIAMLIALLGFLLLLEPKILWRLFLKERKLENGMEAMLRLIGIACFVLAVGIAKLV